MTVQFTFAVPKDKNDKNFEKVILNSNVNICKLIGGVVGDFFSKSVLYNLKKSSNTTSCPMTKVGKYL
jgi:hypothetical protein